jgi:hypothetical protein
VTPFLVDVVINYHIIYHIYRIAKEVVTAKLTFANEPSSKQLGRKIIHDHEMCTIYLPDRNCCLLMPNLFVRIRDEDSETGNDTIFIAVQEWKKITSRDRSTRIACI